MGLKIRFLVPAFDEILNKITQDRTGLGPRVPLLHEAASLSLRGCLLLEAACFSLSLRGCLVVSRGCLLLEAASPGSSVLGRNTVRKEPEYLVPGSPESTTSTELESSDSPYKDLEPGPADISVFALLG